MTPPPGEYLDDTTAEIKQAVDIVTVIGEYLHLESHGGKFRGLCPFHEDHTPSLNVNPQYQNYRCWACGAKGDVFTFVQTIERITFIQAKEKLAEKAGIVLQKNSTERSSRKQSLFDVLAWAQEQFQNCLFDSRAGAEARQYLNQRGLTDETARRYGLGYAPPQYEWLLYRARKSEIPVEQLLKAGLVRKYEDRGSWSDFFHNRLMFTVRDDRKRVIGFGGRTLMEDRGPKYLNTPATEIYNKSEVLYGIDAALDGMASVPVAKRERTLIVMEGYTDCLMAYQHGVTNAVATCGTALTAQHIRKLKTYADRVVLMFDGDAAGQKAASAAAVLFLSSELDLRLCVLPDDLDPCDFLKARGADAFRERLTKAPDVLDFHIGRAREQYNTDSLEGRRKAVDGILMLLCNVPELARQEHAIKYQLALNKVGNAFGFDEPTLRRRIQELRKSAPSEHQATVAREVESEIPMDRRERAVVQIIVCKPACAGQLRELFPLEQIRHPLLRRLTELCYRLHEELGEECTTNDLRERLGDPQIDSFVLELCETAPTGEYFDQGLRDIKATLAGFQRKALRGLESQQLTPDASVQDHLEMLRQLRKKQAL